VSLSEHKELEHYLNIRSIFFKKLFNIQSLRVISMDEKNMLHQIVWNFYQPIRVMALNIIKIVTPRSQCNILHYRAASIGTF